ncbi:MAG: cytochrome c oxidase subunit II [Vicinamibacterales bacterium]
MPDSFPLFPERASTMAGRVDALYFFLVTLSAFFVLLIAGLIIFFSIRYRRRRHGEVGTSVQPSLLLEAIWIAVPAGIAMVIFVWGAWVYFAMASVPAEALDVYVVGKQWMWKFQHPGGQREINELHVPVGRPVRLTMTSEDVIHDLYIPAFRIKADVIPGRYATAWFEATKVGTYHLFCAEYCGTQHSGMRGRVVVMEPQEYQAWLGGATGSGSMAGAGEKLFQDLGCNTCHLETGQGRGPVLQGLFGRPVALQNGQVVTADEAYLRESILNPAGKVVAGFMPIMPTFQGLVSEEQVLQLIEYIKSLQVQGPAAQPQAGVEGPRPDETTPAGEPKRK